MEIQVCAETYRTRFSGMLSGIPLPRALCVMLGDNGGISSSLCPVQAVIFAAPTCRFVSCLGNFSYPGLCHR